jgi:hypothetical protein
MLPGYNTPRLRGDRGGLNRLPRFAEHMAPMRFAPVVKKMFTPRIVATYFLFQEP